MKPHKKPAIDIFFHAAKEPEIVDVPAAKYIVVEGTGAPEQAEFQAAVAALYGVAFTMKFTTKKTGGADYKVSPLEALWFDLGAARAKWRWKAMIQVPEAVTKTEVEAAKAAVIAKRGDGVVSKVALERFAEGRVVQLLHVGPYSTEPESVAKMRALMEDSKLAPRGQHHEIYLGDPRRTKPARLKTILRQPVA